MFGKDRTLSNTVCHNVAFVVPSFSGHFIHLKNFLSSFLDAFKKGDVCDVIVVMSTKEEIEKFLSKHPHFENPHFKFESLDEYLEYQNKIRKFRKSDGIINAKKFYGIYKNLDKNYDFFIPVDCESHIISLENLYEKCLLEDSLKKVYGTRIEGKPGRPTRS